MLASEPVASADNLPTADQVGPEAMPAEIAPIDAPFEMPKLHRPEFGDRRTVLQFGDDAELVTPTIQNAIDQMSAAGGGTVVLPPGAWRTGRIILRSGVNLHVPKETTLKFSGRIEDYLPVVFARYEGLEIMSLGGLIYAHDAERIAITGGGQLIGPDDGPVREARPGLSDQVVDPALPVEQRIMDGREGRHYFRPQFVFLIGCRDVLIEGITLKNGPMWNIVPTYCDGVTVRGVTVESRGVVNGDGVNIESSRHVLVEYCRVNTGDDCFAMKAGRGTDGVRAGVPVENVVLRHNHATGGFGGITCGSETAGGIRDVYAHDCVFENVRHAVYLKTRRPRGGGGERITIERIRFTSYHHGIFFDMIGSPMYVGELGNRLPRREVTPVTPFYRNLLIRDIQGTARKGDAVKIKGIPESPAQGLMLQQIDISAEGLPNLTDVKYVVFSKSTFRATKPELLLRNAYHVKFANCTLDVAGQRPKIVVAEKESASVRFENTTPELSAGDVEVSDGASGDAVVFE